MVPLDHVRGDRQAPEQCVGGRGGPLGDQLGPEFGTVRIGADHATGRQRQQLGAQADARGSVRRRRPPSPTVPAPAAATGVDVVRAHRTAQHEQSRVVAQGRRKVVAGVGPTDVQGHAGGREPVAQPTRRVVRPGLYDQQHRLDLFRAHGNPQY